MADNYIDGQTLVAVENMTSHRCGYALDNGTRRRFAPHARMTVPAEEIRQAVYEHGNYIFVNELRVTDKDLATEIGVPEDMVEYYWTEDDIKEALTEKPIEEFLDAVDFGPEGVKEEMATLAVEMEISDNSRREALQEATGKNITAQIENKHAYDTKEEKEETKKSTASTTRKRRTSTTKSTTSKSTTTAAKKSTSTRSRSTKKTTTKTDAE